MVACRQKRIRTRDQISVNLLMERIERKDSYEPVRDEHSFIIFFKRSSDNGSTASYEKDVKENVQEQKKAYCKEMVKESKELLDGTGPLSVYHKKALFSGIRYAQLYGRGKSFNMSSENFQKNNESNRQSKIK